MLRKKIATLAILVVLLVSLFGTAGAQGETPTDTVPEGEATTETGGSMFFTHPVVQVLSAYFDREPAVEDAEVVTDGGGAEVGENESGLGPIGEEIARLHEEGMGFGVLVKLYAMAEASQLACTGETSECKLVTAEELVASFKGGAGLGTLFKEHGKPALLGIGHVKRELKRLGQEPVVDDGEDGEDDQTELNADDENGKGKDKVKNAKPVNVKPVKDKSKGPKK